MSKPKVYIAENVPEEVEGYIAKFCDYEKWGREEKIPRNELLNKISDKDGVILAGIKIDEEFLNHAPKLKIVSNISVGYNNFDIEAMKNRGVIGTNTPRVLDDTVADLIFGLVLSTARRIAELDRYVKNHEWRVAGHNDIFGLDVHHTTMGIVGMGRIGEAVAKRAKLGFDMEVLYYNRNRKDEVEKKLGVKHCDLESLLAKSDFVVVMVPLTKDTYHIIDSKAFNLMKKTAIFINASRGQTVDEEALIEALQTNRIFGAGLDVYETEPLSTESPLLKLSNVVTVPHIGSATKKTRFDMAMLAASNLVEALSGKVPGDIIPEFRK